MNFLFIEELLLDIIDHKVFCVKCDHCEKTLANNFSLRRHIKLVHDASFFMQNHFFLTEDKKHVCPKCSKTFDDKSNYSSFAFDKTVEIFGSVAETDMH